jgi:hypothetical protein
MKLKRLNPRQKKLVKHLLQGKSLQDSAALAGYSQETLSQSASQALRLVKKKMPELMDDIGLTDKRLLAKYLLPALEANETKFFQHEGMVTDSREVIAWGPRLEALDKAFRLKGSFEADNQRHAVMPIGVMVQVEHIGTQAENSAEAKLTVEVVGHAEAN